WWPAEFASGDYVDYLTLAIGDEKDRHFLGELAGGTSLRASDVSCPFLISVASRCRAEQD
ncbi:MAG: hypothetical protein EA424_26500, partial [Planctomycetaceae bacterium]